MAKRMTDTDKWKKQFFKAMPLEYKCFWLFILDDCNHAGIWEVDQEVAELRLGTQLSLEKARGFFAGRVVEFDNGTKWFIPDFLRFQYGDFGPANKMYKSVFSVLKRYGLDENMDFQMPHRYPIDTPLDPPSDAPLDGAKDKVMVKVKEEDKEKVKDKELPKIEKFGQPPKLEDVKYFFRGQGGTDEMAEHFWNKWDAVGWETRNGPVINWGALAMNFKSNWTKNKTNDTTRRSTTKPNPDNTGNFGQL